MVNISKLDDSAIKFTFTNNDRYLYNGEITVPLNSLILVLDESDMAVLKKIDGDVFLTFLISNSNFSSKSDLEEWFKENACGSTGGGGGVTSGEVETMIEAATSGKADTSAVTEAISSAVSGKVNTSAFNTYSAATDARIAEDEEVTAAALNSLDEKIGDPYQKVSGLTIETNNEGDVPYPFISIEMVEGSNSNRTYISSDGGLESTLENYTDGSYYSSYIDQGSLCNSVTDYPDKNITCERNLEVTTDGFRQTTDENYDDGESSYTRYSSENTFNYGNGLTLSQQWYNVKNDTTTNSSLNIINNIDGETYIELTDHNERTVSIKPNMLSWDDNRDRGDIEWNQIATLDDIDAAKAYYINFMTIDSMRDEDWNGIVAAIDDHRPIYAGYLMGGTMRYYGVEYMSKNSGNTEIEMAVSDNSQHYFYTLTKNGSNDYSVTFETREYVSQAEKAAWNTVSGKVETSAITSAITSASTNSEVAGAKAVYDAIQAGGGGGTTYSAGTNISIANDTINCTLPITANTSKLTIGSNSFVTDINYGSIALGRNSQAKAYRSLAGGEGSNVSLAATNGFAWGIAANVNINSNAAGAASIGYQTKSTIQNAFSIGRYNSIADANTGENFGSSGNTLFAVGNGTAENARHNALEVRQNGDIYVNDGTNDVRLQDTILALGGLKFVKLTQAQYDALATKDANTLYIISNVVS